MTVAADRTLDNSIDVNRKIPAGSLSPLVLLESEGAVFEKITGPTSNATVPLQAPAKGVLHIFAYVTADGLAPAGAGLQPNPLEGTHWSLSPKNADGVAEITELAGTDRSAETWLVIYQRDVQDETTGGVSTVA